MSRDDRGRRVSVFVDDRGLCSVVSFLPLLALCWVSCLAAKDNEYVTAMSVAINGASSPALKISVYPELKKSLFLWLPVGGVM